MSRDTGSDNEIAKDLFLENVTGVFGLINDTIGCEEKGNGAKSVPSSTSPHHHPNIGGKEKKRGENILLTSICLRYSSTEVSVKGFEIAIPAFATKTSNRPKSLTIEFIVSSTLFGSDTSN